MQSLSKAPEAAHCPAPMVTQGFTFHSSLHFNAGRDSLILLFSPSNKWRLAVGKAVPGAVSLPGLGERPQLAYLARLP